MLAFSLCPDPVLVEVWHSLLPAAGESSLVLQLLLSLMELLFVRLLEAVLGVGTMFVLGLETVTEMLAAVLHSGELLAFSSSLVSAVTNFLVGLCSMGED